MAAEGESTRDPQPPNRWGRKQKPKQQRQTSWRERPRAAEHCPLEKADKTPIFPPLSSLRANRTPAWSGQAAVTIYSAGDPLPSARRLSPNAETQPCGPGVAAAGAVPPGLLAVETFSRKRSPQCLKRATPRRRAAAASAAGCACSNTPPRGKRRSSATAGGPPSRRSGKWPTPLLLGLDALRAARSGGRDGSRALESAQLDRPAAEAIKQHARARTCAVWREYRLRVAVPKARWRREAGADHRGGQASVTTCRSAVHLLRLGERERPSPSASTHTSGKTYALSDSRLRSSRILRALIIDRGIGPKLALSVMSGIDPPDLVRAIKAQDVARLPDPRGR